MSDTKDISVAGEGSSLVQQVRCEESREWVVATYRKHMLALVSAELNAELGGGRGNARYIYPVLLDVNSVEFRQSLQQRVFPVPRVVNEDLLEVSQGKVMLEAGSGIGKTTFLKVYQETLLSGEPNPWFPLAVYFHLGNLPEASGISRFYERLCGEILAVILLEKNENPELQLDEQAIIRTIESMLNSSKVLLLLDGMDQLPPEDRFQVYHAIMVQGDALKSNFVILASRPVQFGPVATNAVIRKGKESAFRISIQTIEEREREPYLRGALVRDEMEKFQLFYPEMLTTPILLKMIRAGSATLEGVFNRTDLYTACYTQLLQAAKPGGDTDWISRCFARLADISFASLMQGRSQRFEGVETGFRKDNNCTDDLVFKEGNILPVWDGILQQTPLQWEYRHPSFQEYFAARKLAVSDDWRDIVRRRCRDEKWREVLRFFAGLAPQFNNELYDIYLDEGALFIAGDSLPETKELSLERRLLTEQFLKYQCKEKCPQFARFRLAKISEITAICGMPYLKNLISRLLRRENRDSRILFGVFELLLALYEIDIHKIADQLDFSCINAIEEIKEFLRESKGSAQVNIPAVKRWSEMVTVSAGKFIYQMEKDDEDRIDLKEYSIMKYPATNALYMEFDPNYRPIFPEYSNQPDQPVIGINFYEAFIFSIWLGKRLPTEKEWEKAARGVDGRDYPWGEACGYQSGYANTCDFLGGRTNSVTEYDLGISPYGCHDMSGNVWEWCVQINSSRYTTQKIVRGGSWLNYLVHAKCTYRNSFDPAERHLTVGLRCVSLPLTDVENEGGNEDDY